MLILLIINDFSNVRRKSYHCLGWRSNSSNADTANEKNVQEWSIFQHKNSTKTPEIHCSIGYLDEMKRNG